MKIDFKSLPYQTLAVNAVVDVFAGQPKSTGINYRIDPGVVRVPTVAPAGAQLALIDTPDVSTEYAGFRNADINPALNVLANIRTVQIAQNLPVSEALVKSKVCSINLDIEMETGTGKTYCYIKTMFELNQKYGWSKFIVVVPSIAIREGVAKSFEMTAEHFLRDPNYGKKARFFIYNSKQLHNLEAYSSDAGINVMIINVQAFNATGKDARRIYEALDDFQSRKPIDVIAANRPILILDEPQKMEGGKTLDALANFKPLMILRYSATHKTTHNKIHRLDALDAYTQKLVKKIAVRGISVKGLAGTSPYLYLQSIEISSKHPPVARVEFEQKLKTGAIKRVLRKLNKGDNLFDFSNQLDAYRGYVVADINAVNDTLTFTNGVVLDAGDVLGDENEMALRRIQIRETIKAHFDKEQTLFYQGIKVLSLFFIDEVKKYRDYDAIDDKGIYAQIFEEEYTQYLNEVLDLEETPYIQYLKQIGVTKTHNGYFSIDKKSKRLVDSETKRNSDEADDVDAYDLILKDKERLLSFDEPVRFIFSHSALREGWDNPNVFVICALKHSDNTTSRRQEVGRGLRLCVNQRGERMDKLEIVHDVNVLTVVASESYKDFVTALQKDIGDSLSARPRIANEDYFIGKTIQTAAGASEITTQQAKQIYRFLVKNDYTDDNDNITAKYHEDKKTEMLAKLPEELQPIAEQVWTLIDSVYSDSNAYEVSNDRNNKINPLNANFYKKEFQELWARINHKAVYTVKFDSSELVKKCETALAQLRVTHLQAVVQTGEQLAVDKTTADSFKDGAAFKVINTETESIRQSVHSAVKYDLIGNVAQGTELTRKTVAEIIKSMNVAVFAQFKTNPEHFLAEVTRIINEQKATMVIEHLAYDTLQETFTSDIFTADKTRQDFSNAGNPLSRHIYDYVLTDSKVERDFVSELDTSADVVVYAKLPKGFLIPTPVGDYNPDWAIAFTNQGVKHIYFVAETKGSMSSMDLRPVEQTKINCAKKFFDTLSLKCATNPIKYDVITRFDKLMNIVK